jgi:hypothetical protein
MKHTIHETIKDEINLMLGDEITLYASDDTGLEQPICAVEIWEGQLRVLVWPDAEDADSGPIIHPIRRII